MKAKAGASYLAESPAINCFGNLGAIWVKVFELISDNVTNPKKKSGKWIWSAYPENLLAEEGSEKQIRDEYPIIVIEPIAANTRNATIDNETRLAGIEITIEVYSDRSDYLDIITDSIASIILNNNLYFYRLNIVNIRLSSAIYSHLFRGTVPIHVRSMKFIGDVI